MKSRISFVCFVLLLLTGCTTVPITGRSQFNTVPDSLINSMALQEYNSFLRNPENKLSTDPEKTAMVKRVGKRMQESVAFVRACLSDAQARKELDDKVDPGVVGWMVTGALRGAARTKTDPTQAWQDVQRALFRPAGKRTKS